jgi:hypothetical protein
VRIELTILACSLCYLSVDFQFNANFLCYHIKNVKQAGRLNKDLQYTFYWFNDDSIKSLLFNCLKNHKTYGKHTGHKMFHFSPQLLFEIFFGRDAHRNARKHSCKVNVTCSILTKTGMCQQNSANLPNINLHDNPLRF